MLPYPGRGTPLLPRACSSNNSPDSTAVSNPNAYRPVKINDLFAPRSPHKPSLALFSRRPTVAPRAVVAVFF